MSKKIFIAALMVSVAAALVQAHDGWIDKRDGELTFFYGHGAKIDPYKPEYIREARAFDSKGNSIPVEIVRHKDYAAITPNGDPVIVTSALLQRLLGQDT